MRVTDLTIQRNFLYNIFAVEKRLGELQDMASSGKSITRPQDDPVGSERSISLRHDLCVNDQYLRNIDKAKTWMSQTEQAMAHVTTVLSRAHDLALTGMTGTTPEDAREAISAEISQLKDELSGVFDTTVDGRNPVSYTHLYQGVYLTSQVPKHISNRLTCFHQLCARSLGLWF